MNVVYNLLAISPYAYTVLTSLIVITTKTYKKQKFSFLNFLKSYIYLIPSILLSILAICIVPHDEYDLFITIIVSFVFPIIYHLMIWGISIFIRKFTPNDDDNNKKINHDDASEASINEEEKEVDPALKTKMNGAAFVIVWFTFYIFAANLCFIVECCFSTINYSWITNNMVFFIFAFVLFIEKKYINTKLIVILFAITVLIATIIYVPLTILKNSYSWVFLVALIVINAIFLFKYLFIKVPKSSTDSET